MVPPNPRTAFEVIEADFLVELPIVHLDPPAAFGEADEAPQAEPLAAEVREPVRRRRRRLARPFDEQLDGFGRHGAGDGAAVREPHGEPGEA